TGAMMVRQEERPWHGESLVLMDTRAHAYPGATSEARESDPLEWAVSAAASIACHIAERGRKGSLVSGDGRVAHDDSASIPNLLGEQTWQVGADALRASGWRVVGVSAGDELGKLWPALLSTRVGVQR